LVERIVRRNWRWRVIIGTMDARLDEQRRRDRAMYEAIVTKTLSNEDRMILAETFAARAEEHLAQQREPDYAAAIEDVRHLCETLGVDVRPTPNTFAAERERIILAYGYALRVKKALAGERTRDLARFVEGLCANLGIDIESADFGTHTKDVVEHVVLHLS
jgi:hypothetical protein